MKTLLSALIALTSIGYAQYEVAPYTSYQWFEDSRNALNNNMTGGYIKMPPGTNDGILFVDGSFQVGGVNVRPRRFLLFGDGVQRYTNAGQDYLRLDSTWLNNNYVSDSDFTWTNLSGKPTAVSSFTNDAGYLSTVSWSIITGKPSFFSGSYNDLTGIPTSFTPSAHTHLSTDISDSSVIGRSVLTAANGASIRTAIGAGTSNFSGSYNDLTNQPTLFSGAYADLIGKPTLFSGVYGDLTGIPSTFTPAAHNQAWSTITTTPTTLSGYGITDPVVLTSGSYSDPSWITGLAWSKITGAPSIPAAQVNSDWNAASGVAQILNKPSAFPPTAHNQAWSTITGTPTTLSGYGITDAYPLSGNPSAFVNQAGARSAISLTTTGSGAATYNSGTGVLNVPTPVAAKRQETYSGTTNASGQYTVTFGTAYAVAPNIQAGLINGADNQNLRVTSITTTGFTVLARNRVDVIGLLPTWTNVSGIGIDVLITEK